MAVNASGAWRSPPGSERPGVRSPCGLPDDSSLMNSPAWLPVKIVIPQRKPLSSSIADRLTGGPRLGGWSSPHRCMIGRTCRPVSIQRGLIQYGQDLDSAAGRQVAWPLDVINHCFRPDRDPSRAIGHLLEIDRAVAARIL